MIQNKGHHEHEWYSKCECDKCNCDHYPYEKICFFCRHGSHFETKGKPRIVK